MQQLTGIERMTNILNHQPVDRIGLYEHFWNDTQREWAKAGDVPADQVTIGSSVTITAVKTGASRTFKIVGSQEADAMKGSISDALYVMPALIRSNVMPSAPSVFHGAMCAARWSAVSAKP